MARINLTKMGDPEEYSDSTQIKGFRKGVQVNVNEEEIRLNKTRQNCTKQNNRNYIISRREHERKMYKQREENARRKQEALDIEEEMNK